MQRRGTQKGLQSTHDVSPTDPRVASADNGRRSAGEPWKTPLPLAAMSGGSSFRIAFIISTADSRPNVTEGGAGSASRREWRRRKKIRALVGGEHSDLPPATCIRPFPIGVPGSVGRPSVGRALPPAGSSGRDSLASPKSRIFTTQSLLRAAAASSESRLRSRVVHRGRAALRRFFERAEKLGQVFIAARAPKRHSDVVMTEEENRAIPRMRGGHRTDLFQRADQESASVCWRRVRVEPRWMGRKRTPGPGGGGW